MKFIFLLLLTLAEIAIGFGVTSLFRIKLDRIPVLSLSLVVGIGIVSLEPFLLQMFYIPVNYLSVFGGLALIIALLLIPGVRYFKQYAGTFRLPRIVLYEWPWILMIGLLVFIAANRCYIMPPYPRDLLTGPEPIAEYAVKEHSFINSVFEQDLTNNNNPFKSLYIPALQVVYKLIGFQFGKVWLSLLSIGLITFLYKAVSSILHPVLAGAIVLLFLFTPELYAYMYMVLYDYSNMVFLFFSLFFLKEYLDNNKSNYLFFSAVLMGIATYIRSETLIISGFILCYILLVKIYRRNRLVDILPSLLIIFIPFMVYFFSSYVYLNYYLPVLYDVGDLVNNNLFDLSPFFNRIYAMTTELVLFGKGIIYWGYFFWMALILLITELLVYRKLTKGGAYWLSMFFIVYLSIAFIGFLLPLADLSNTTKRALFKVIPLLTMYLSYNRLLQSLSISISTKREKVTSKQKSRTGNKHKLKNA